MGQSSNKVKNDFIALYRIVVKNKLIPAKVEYYTSPYYPGWVGMGITFRPDKFGGTVTHNITIAIGPNK